MCGKRELFCCYMCVCAHHSCKLSMCSIVSSLFCFRNDKETWTKGICPLGVHTVTLYLQVICASDKSVAVAIDHVWEAEPG